MSRDDAIYDAIYTLFSDGPSQGVLDPAQPRPPLPLPQGRPGVHFETAADLAGRTGLGFWRVGEGYLKQQLVIDPVTYTFLGYEDVAVADHAMVGTDGTRYVKKGHVMVLAAGPRQRDRPKARPAPVTCPAHSTPPPRGGPAADCPAAGPGMPALRQFSNGNRRCCGGWDPRTRDSRACEQVLAVLGVLAEVGEDGPGRRCRTRARRSRPHAIRSSTGRSHRSLGGTVQPLETAAVQVDSLRAISVWKKNCGYCLPFDVGNCSTKVDGYSVRRAPVGHSAQYGVPSKSRSPFWKRLSWQPVAWSGACWCRARQSRMGITGGSRRVTGLGVVLSGGPRSRMGPSTRCSAAGVGRVDRVGGERVAERGAGLEVPGLELGADVRLQGRPRNDVGGLRGRVLRLEVVRRPCAVGDRGVLEAVGGRGLHEAARVPCRSSMTTSKALPPPGAGASDMWILILSPGFISSVSLFG